MMKIKKYLFIAIAAAAIFSSCSEEIAKDEEENEPEDNSVVFTATIEGGETTRTTLGSDKRPHWRSSDRVAINGGIYAADPDATDATEATLRLISGTTSGSTYKAYYPMELYTMKESDNPSLPSSYSYAKDELSDQDEFNMPMYAESTTHTLDFKNICAVLAIKVTSADISTLTSIMVKSDKSVCGEFTVEDKAAVPTFANLAYNRNRSVTLSSSNPLTLDSDGTTFYLPVFAQEYSYLIIYLSADGSSYKECMATKRPDGLGALERNTIYAIDYEKNAVQMSSGGPYWSTMNVGASSPSEFGTYFAWGETTGYDYTAGHDFSYSSYALSAGMSNSFAKYCTSESYGTVDNKSELELDDDAAYKNWGACWRMPSKEQINTLIETSTANWVHESSKYYGLLTSNETGSNLYIMAAGYYNSTEIQELSNSCSFWSRTLDSNHNHSAFSIYLAPTVDDGLTPALNSNLRYHGRSIRPVLSE